MKILLANDDGVLAPGINILKDVLSAVADVTIVAPMEERSTTGHTLSLDHPIRLEQIDENIYGCSGYPADCVLMGISHLFKDNPPDLVVSGINRGANLGQDYYCSGTAAAARQAITCNVKSIAVSTCLDFLRPDEHIHFETAARFIKLLIKSKLHESIHKHTMLNINVPNLGMDEIEGVEVTNLGLRNYSETVEERIDFRNRPYYWLGGVYEGFEEVSGSDCLAIHNKRISVSPLNLFMNNSDSKDEWSQLISAINL